MRRCLAHLSTPKPESPRILSDPTLPVQSRGTVSDSPEADLHVREAPSPLLGVKKKNEIKTNAGRASKTKPTPLPLA